MSRLVVVALSAMGSLALLLPFVACSSSTPAQPSTTEDAGPDAPTFDCEDEKCVVGKEYCGIVYDGKEVDKAACAELPEDCTSCKCILSDAEEKFDDKCKQTNFTKPACKLAQDNYVVDCNKP